MSNAIIRSATRDDLPGVLDLYRYLHPDDLQSCTLSIIPNLTRGARSYGVIENVVTHPGHRRTGLGRSVLASALEAAWDANCYKVMLATGSPKSETLRFYESAGFERGGKTFFQARRP
jgi:GNAT superfamily N-acetyltransferase